MDTLMLTRRWIPWLGIASLPLATFVLLDRGAVHDPIWMVPDLHFFVVTLTSFVTLILAGLMVVAASQVRDGRVVCLSLAFLAIAGIFAVHGLTTPGALVEGVNPWVGFSARLSLLVGAAFLVLSMVDRPVWLQHAIVRRQWVVTGTFMAVLVLYGTFALWDSSRDTSARAVDGSAVTAGSTYGENPSSGVYGAASHAHGAPMAGNPVDMGRFEVLASDSVGWAVTMATLLMLASAIAHYLRLYRLARGPLLAGFLATGIFLFQAQVIMSFGTLWHASWWSYHVLLLAAFTVAVGGLVVEYSQKGSIGTVVGGLLARDTVTQIQRGYTDVIVALVAAVEAKDPYTRGHSQRVTELAVRIGEDLRLPLHQLRVLAQAAMLHDIGKIGVPDVILNKPGKLTEEEFAVVREHPLRGDQIIREVRSLQAELVGIRSHHERLDGSGYPDGLRDDEIPLIARIIAVADVFDALTSERSYRAAWTVDSAMREIEREAGTKLDRACVASLRRVLIGATEPMSADRTILHREHVLRPLHDDAALILSAGATHSLHRS